MAVGDSVEIFSSSAFTNVHTVNRTAQTAGDIPALVTTADSAIDAVQADLDNATDGLGALKALIDTVNTDLSNGTDGLGALKTLIDTVNTDLGNGTDGLGALKTLIDAIQTDLDNGTDGLGALKTLIDAVQSTANNVETDTQDIQTRLPAALTGAGNIKSDMLAVNGDTAAAAMLEALMDGGILAQVNAGTPTTTTFIGDGFTEATDDHFNGRLITWVTGALKGQQTAITDYDGGTQLFTVDLMTEAPADDDWFVIH